MLSKLVPKGGQRCGFGITVMRMAGKAVFIVSRRYILGFKILKLIDFAGCARVSCNLMSQEIKRWGRVGLWLRGA